MMKSFQGHYLCSGFFQVLFSFVKAPNGPAPSSADFIVFLFSHCYLSFLSANTPPASRNFPLMCCVGVGNHGTAYCMPGSGRQAPKEASRGVSGSSMNERCCTDLATLF